jgi:hypothetical protein
LPINRLFEIKWRAVPLAVRPFGPNKNWTGRLTIGIFKTAINPLGPKEKLDLKRFEKRFDICAPLWYLS